MGNSIRLTLLIASILFLNNSATHGQVAAQVGVKYKLNFLYDENNVSIEKIQFVDEVTGKDIGEFNVLENNPYDSLKYPVVEKNTYSFKIYALNNSIDTFFLSAKDIDSTSLPSKSVKNASSYTTVYKEGKEIAAVGYILESTDADGKIIGLRSSVKVVRAPGVVIADLKHLNVDVRSITVTENGHFPAFNYGGVIDENGYNSVK